MRENQLYAVFGSSGRDGRFEPDYTTFPVRDFIGKPELFPNKHEYQKMVETYQRLRETIQYGE